MPTYETKDALGDLRNALRIGTIFSMHGIDECLVSTTVNCLY
jgi:hypothetical protein